ncbi:hypothetical protein BH23PLA1_BH23PLA1_29910 [soil metagenome]
MELSNRPLLPLPLRAWDAWRRRGPRYVWHKALRRTLERWPDWKRQILYKNPREYWNLRGGHDYYREQEGQTTRSERALWLSGRIATYRPLSILEIGCGYGKQLRELRGRIEAPLVGLDFSASQLELAGGYLDGLEGIKLVLGSGDRLPFPDQSFDLVLTSAVILHNVPEVAHRIRNEVIRVARRWSAHNEDTDVTYNRFGYDTAAWYRSIGIPLAEVGSIPDGTDPASSQFCVADLSPWRA